LRLHGKVARQLTPTIITAVQNQLMSTGLRKQRPRPVHELVSVRDLQETSQDLLACQSNQAITTRATLHRQDAENAQGADKPSIEAALAKCPPNQQQLLHFVDQDSAPQDAGAGRGRLIACLGATDRATP